MKLLQILLQLCFVIIAVKSEDKERTFIQLKQLRRVDTLNGNSKINGTVYKEKEIIKTYHHIVKKILPPYPEDPITEIVEQAEIKEKQKAKRQKEINLQKYNIMKNKRKHNNTNVKHNKDSDGKKAKYKNKAKYYKKKTGHKLKYHHDKENNYSHSKNETKNPYKKGNHSLSKAKYNKKPTYYKKKTGQKVKYHHDKENKYSNRKNKTKYPYKKGNHSLSKIKYKNNDTYYAKNETNKSESIKENNQDIKVLQKYKRNSKPSFKGFAKANKVSEMEGDAFKTLIDEQEMARKTILRMNKVVGSEFHRNLRHRKKRNIDIQKYGVTHSSLSLTNAPEFIDDFSRRSLPQYNSILAIGENRNRSRQTRDKKNQVFVHVFSGNGHLEKNITKTTVTRENSTGISRKKPILKPQKGNLPRKKTTAKTTSKPIDMHKSTKVVTKPIKEQTITNSTLNPLKEENVTKSTIKPIGQQSKAGIKPVKTTKKSKATTKFVSITNTYKPSSPEKFVGQASTKVTLKTSTSESLARPTYKQTSTTKPFNISSVVLKELNKQSAGKYLIQPFPTQKSYYSFDNTTRMHAREYGIIWNPRIVIVSFKPIINPTPTYIPAGIPKWYNTATTNKAFEMLTNKKLPSSPRIGMASKPIINPTSTYIPAGIPKWYNTATTNKAFEMLTNKKLPAIPRIGMTSTTKKALAWNQEKVTTSYKSPTLKPSVPFTMFKWHSEATTKSLVKQKNKEQQFFYKKVIEVTKSKPKIIQENGENWDSRKITPNLKPKPRPTYLTTSIFRLYPTKETDRSSTTNYKKIPIFPEAKKKTAKPKITSIYENVYDNIYSHIRFSQPRISSTARFTIHGKYPWFTKPVMYSKLYNVRPITPSTKYEVLSPSSTEVGLEELIKLIEEELPEEKIELVTHEIKLKQEVLAIEPIMHKNISEKLHLQEAKLKISDFLLWLLTMFCLLLIVGMAFLIYISNMKDKIYGVFAPDDKTSQDKKFNSTFLKRRDETVIDIAEEKEINNRLTEDMKHLATYVQQALDQSTFYDDEELLKMYAGSEHINMMMKET